MGRKEVSGSEEFDHWLSESVLLPPQEREDRLLNWSSGPFARLCHPREEHLMPLHVVACAAPEGKSQMDYSETVLGAKISAYQFG
jgi:aromatic ring-opening dioxygenase catalytic subunit (LigB family)